MTPELHDLFDAVAVRRFRLRLSAHGPWTPNGAAASDAWGALGDHLHDTPLYATLFKAPLPQGEVPRHLRGGQGAPPPLLLRRVSDEPVRRAGDHLELELLLFNSALDHADAVVRALLDAADEGLRGRHARQSFDADEVLEQGPMLLTHHVEDRWKELSHGDDRPRLRVSTRPAAILRQRGHHQAPDLPQITRAALRRAVDMAWCHGAWRGAFDARPLIEQAEQAWITGEADREFRRSRGGRRSARQDTRVPLHGFSGWFDQHLSIDEAAPLLAAELLGVGKKVGLGMGVVRVGNPARGL